MSDKQVQRLKIIKENLEISRLKMIYKQTWQINPPSNNK